MEECLIRQREPLPTSVDLLPGLPAAYEHAIDVVQPAMSPFDRVLDVVRRTLGRPVRTPRPG